MMQKTCNQFTGNAWAASFHEKKQLLYLPCKTCQNVSHIFVFCEQFYLNTSEEAYWSAHNALRVKELYEKDQCISS